MLTQHIALVPEAGGVSASELSRVCAALQKQVTRDFAPIWSIAATVDAFPQLEEVPIGYWPIILSADTLGGSAGIHHDDNGQPYAQLELGRDWSLSASRVCMEMLVNATGERTVSGPSLRSDQGVVEFLIEVCGTCANSDQSYLIHDVLVSDFCTPAYFATAAQGDRRRYSFYGSLTAPLELPPGGHLAWYEPISSSWWVRSFWEHNPVDTELGSLDGRDLSARELVKQLGPLEGRGGSQRRNLREAQAHTNHHRLLQASQHRARRLRALLAQHAEPKAKTERASRVPDLSGAYSTPAVCDEDEATNLWDGVRSVELEDEDIERILDVVAEEVAESVEGLAEEVEDVLTPEPRAYLQRRPRVTYPPPRRTPPPFVPPALSRAPIKGAATMRGRPPSVIDAPVEAAEAPRAPAVTQAPAPPLSFFPVSGSVAPPASPSIKGTSWVSVAGLAIAASLAFVWISRGVAVPSDRRERQFSAQPQAATQTSPPAQATAAVPTSNVAAAPIPNVTPIVTPVSDPSAQPAVRAEATESSKASPTLAATEPAPTAKVRRAPRLREPAAAAPVVTNSDLPARSKRARPVSRDAELFSPLPPNPFDSAADGSMAELLDTRR